LLNYNTILLVLTTQCIQLQCPRWRRSAPSSTRSKLVILLQYIRFGTRYGSSLSILNPGNKGIPMKSLVTINAKMCSISIRRRINWGASVHDSVAPNRNSSMIWRLRLMRSRHFTNSYSLPILGYRNCNKFSYRCRNYHLPFGFSLSEGYSHKSNNPVPSVPKCDSTKSRHSLLLEFQILLVESTP